MKTVPIGLCLLVATSMLCTAAASASDLRVPANPPPAYLAECGSCHVAFPPSLLMADDWKRIMARLDKHYGDNASLDVPTREVIEGFLVKQAGQGRRVASAPLAKPTDLPRLTTTPWFVRKHHEVPRAVWSHAKVKTPSNCVACHTRAGEGSYREREIVMPNGQRWED